MIVQTLNKLKDILINDIDIIDFCQTNYKKDQTVFIGENENEEPPETDYPVIVLSGIEWKKGREKLAGEISAFLWTGILNSTLTETGREVTTPGLFDAIEFMETVQDAIREAVTTGPTPRKILPRVDFAGGSEQVTWFPLHVSVSNITIPIIDTKNTYT